MGTTLAGLVLAGGKSTRLGQDKALVSYAGKTLLEHTVALARHFCHEVWLSGRQNTEMAGQLQTIPWLLDNKPGLGPLGGILTGLSQLNRPLLVLACDLPYLDKNTIKRLLQARGRRPKKSVMTTFLQQETGWIEALVSIYEPEATPYLKAAQAKGIYKLSVALPEEVRHHIPYSTDEATPFFNINFPADLAVLRKTK